MDYRESQLTLTEIQLYEKEAMQLYLSSNIELEAVEFAEWIEKGEWACIDKDWENQITCKIITTKELYQLYLQNK